jgi:hypothetical protein
MKRADKIEFHKKTKDRALNVHISGIPIRYYPVGIHDESSASEKYNGSGRHAEIFVNQKNFLNMLFILIELKGIKINICLRCRHPRQLCIVLQ